MGAQVLLVECPDRPGLVHGITGVLFRRGLNIVGNQEFVDRASGRFFMRTEFDGDAKAGDLLAELGAVLPPEALLRLSDLAPKRIVVLASREHHCLADLLVRHAYGELNARILGVISNHEALAPLVARFELPFRHVPHEGRTREAHEAAILAALREFDPEFLVLAKYMRILGPEFVARFPSRIINIHHSFLPAFAGARPYHQAFARGVKVIGATAHFVTEQLDEGPILFQQVMPVDHTHTPQDLAQSGHDVEQLVLARALKLVFEDRVFLCGNRTVIFD
jgi:formyltetrahydrofolate deformylase